MKQWLTAAVFFLTLTLSLPAAEDPPAADAGDAAALEQQALEHLKKNKLDLANQAARQAVEAAPERCQSQIVLARVAIARQDYKTAGTALDKAKELDSGNPEISLYRGSLLLAQKDYKGSVDLLTPYVANHPDEAYGHYYLGLAQYGMKRRDKTVEHFQRFLALAPDAPEASRVESLLRSIR